MRVRINIVIRTAKTEGSRMDTIGCPKCRRTFSLAENAYGGILQLCAPCPYCGHVHRMKHLGAELDRNLKKFLFHRNEDGLHFERKVTRTEGAKLSPREYWLQLYVAERYRQLGFNSVKGPFESGPDFEVRYGGKWNLAEVETTWRNYIRHRHHEDRRFDPVRFLITLDSHVPRSGLDKRLPPRIIQVSQSRFEFWYRPKAKEYAQGKDIEARFAILSNEFHSRFLRYCPEQNRDAAACPYCDVCPYFPGHDVLPSGGGRRVFDKLALMFVARRRSMKPRLATIKSEALDEFFMKNIDRVLGNGTAG